MDEKSAHHASTALTEHPLGAGDSVRMPLCEFLATYAPVNYSSWNEAVRCMTADPIDSETIAVLAADLVDNDQFRRPIVVDPDTRMVETECTAASLRSSPMLPAST
jgi:hypothetical protein